MSRQKINFFQSPNPKHFNLQHIRYDYHPAQDNDIHDDLLFTTPRRNNTQPNNPQDIAENQYGRLRRSSEDISEQHSHHEYMQLQPQSQPGIHAKLQFGEHLQDDLIPLTPLKPHRHRQQQDENLETVRRHPHLQNTSYPNVTPGSENRSNQRGLKKLAAQAYRFVMQQKRASYKQVARRLIEQTGDDTLLIQTNKRGEMNIKRRVYDALNVLIALGLLRRNGNKIFAKKDQFQFSGEDGSLARQRQRRREMMMEQELATLREACERKQVIVQQKRKLQLEMKDKVDRLKEVMERNRTTKQLPSDKDNKLKFPLITLCHNQAVEPATLLKRQNPFSKPSTNIQNEKQEQQLKIWRNNPQQLVCSFNKHQNISLLGEIDLLGTWKSHQRKGKPPKAQKVSRRR